MASGYSKQEILEKLQDASGDMATFYQIPAINYRGRTEDTRQCRQKNYFVNMEHTFHSNTASRLWFQRIKQGKRFKK